MSSDDKAPGVKSAYEAALERLEQRGIEKPRLDSLSGAVREEMAEVRRRAAAGLAQLEIMHRQKIENLSDTHLLRQAEDDYQRERRRIEERREDRLEALRRRSE